MILPVSPATALQGQPAFSTTSEDADQPPILPAGLPLKELFSDLDAALFQVDRVMSHLRCAIHDLRRVTAATEEPRVGLHALVAHLCVEDLRQELGEVGRQVMQLQKLLREGGTP